MVRERGFERLVNFSDAVVAIAATLLVLPLADSDAPRSGSTVPELLVEHRAELLAFALSFAVICNLWWVHHEVYRDLVGYTTPVVVANCVWLASIVFLPFPTQLISSGDSDHPGSASLYIGVIAVASGAMMATRFLVARTPELLRDDARGEAPVVSASVTFGLVLAAFLMSFTPVGLIGLVVLLLTGPTVRLVGRARQRAR